MMEKIGFMSNSFIIFARFCQKVRMLHYKTIVNNQFKNRWLVLVHGAGGSMEVWYRQVADFARHFNLLLVDLAGHGHSSDEAFGKGFNFSKAADQVIEVVNHLKIAKCHFMGLSLGTIVVRIIAERNPRQVESMVLAGAVTQLSVKVRLLIGAADLFKRVIPYGLMKRVLAKCIIPQEKYARSKNLFLNSAKRVSFDSFLGWLKLGDGLNARISKLFSQYITIPTLYVMGEDDKLFLPQVQETVRNGGENVSLVIVPKAGHVCNVDNKHYFNRESLDFLCNI